VAIDAVDLDRRPWFTVIFPLPFDCPAQNGIIALHSFFQMNVREVHRLCRNGSDHQNAICLPSLSSPIPFAVVTKDRTKSSMP